MSHEERGGYFTLMLHCWAPLSTPPGYLPGDDKTLMALSGMLPDPTKSVAHGAAKSAVMTAPTHIGDEARARLSWLMSFA
jgi:hypothetical protein